MNTTLRQNNPPERAIAILAIGDCLAYERLILDHDQGYRNTHKDNGEYFRYTVFEQCRFGDVCRTHI
jgi:hypothetical protein